ncbi:phage tail tape measure protein [Devosia sp. WQ 349]|nr:phage tail tape measure protein [Devosia sp. WQ 349K1]
MREHQRRHTEAFNQHRTELMLTAGAAAALAFALNEPVQQAIAFETQLGRINQKVRLTSEELEALGKQVRQVGLDTATGGAQMVEAVDGLLAIGLDTATAMEVASPIGKVVSAYQADATEMVQLSGALLTNLDFTADQMQRAFDIMATGGDAGQFELADMAASFSEITAAAQGLGISGDKGLADLVAALQVARQGAGSGSAAVTNLSNYLSKIMAPDAIKKFGEAGVDIVAEVERAQKASMSPIEHTIGILSKLTEGGKQDLIGQYFADAEVQKFIRPMIQNLEQYREIRAKALAGDGKLQLDFENWEKSSQGVMSRFEASIENLNLVVGDSLLPSLTRFVESVTPMIDGVASFVEANDELVAAVVQITAALIGLKLLASAGGMAGALLGLGGKPGGGGKPGIPSKPGANTNTPVGNSSGRNFDFMKWGFMAFNAAEIVQDYAHAAETMVHRGANESDADWAARTKAAADAKVAQDAALEKMLLDFSVGGIKPFGAVKAAQDLIHNPQGGLAGGYTGATQGQIDAMKEQIAKLDGQIAEWPDAALEERRAGLALKLQQMQAELAGASVGVTAEVQSLMERIRVIAASGIDIPVRTIGPQISPVVSRAEIAGRRANGGPVKAGYTYEINERGNEFITPGMDSYVHKAGSFVPPGFGSRGSAGGAATMVPTIQGDIIVNLSNPTNADPRTIADMLGAQIADELRASHSNGFM